MVCKQSYSDTLSVSVGNRDIPGLTANIFRIILLCFSNTRYMSPMFTEQTYSELHATVGCSNSWLLVGCSNSQLLTFPVLQFLCQLISEYSWAVPETLRQDCLGELALFPSFRIFPRNSNKYLAFLILRDAGEGTFKI